jgi:hypothetical protein
LFLIGLGYSELVQRSGEIFNKGVEITLSVGPTGQFSEVDS